MADAHGNIGFDENLHAYFAFRLGDAELAVVSMSQMIKALYPNPGDEDADAAQRGALSALRALGRVRRAVEGLKTRETDNGTRSRGCSDGTDSGGGT